MGISPTYGFIDSSPTLDTNGILYIGASDGSVVALDTGSGNSLASNAPGQSSETLLRAMVALSSFYTS